MVAEMRGVPDVEVAAVLGVALIFSFDAIEVDYWRCVGGYLGLGNCHVAKARCAALPA